MKQVIPLALFLSMIIMPTKSYAIQTWFHKEYSQKKLTSEYQDIREHYSEEEIRSIFTEKNLLCETNIIRDLGRLDRRDMKFAILYAAELDLINDIETEVLMGLVKRHRKIQRPSQDTGIKIKNGANTLAKYYERFKDPSLCLSEEWNNFTELIVTDTKDGALDIYSELNLMSVRKRTITKNEYYLLELLNNESKTPNLTIKAYREKIALLEKYGFSINKEFTDFHMITTTDKGQSQRYKLYKNFSVYQLNEMLKLIDNMRTRASVGQSNIVFLDDNGVISEKIELTPTEQLHLSLKLYSKEKTKLIESQVFSASTFSYKDLITAAFELGKIDTYELEALNMLEKKVKERSLLQKSISYADRANFLVTAITGPLGGFVYTLAVGIADNYLNKSDQKATYKHDIFYGNCEMKL